MKNVTIKDVAKAAGVSYSTVSRALSGSPEISADTRERILQVCKDMNYTANTVARAMVMKSTKLLGLILTGVNNPFMSELAYHIDRQARARGYNIILCNSSRDIEQERELFELMIGRQVDGVILLPAGPESYESLQPFFSRLPTVFVGENLRDAQESYVSVDNFRGTYMGVEYLYKLGHRDILFLGGRPSSRTREQRIHGFHRALSEAGLEGRELPAPPDVTLMRQWSYEAASELLKGPLPDAIFAFSDMTALKVMEAAEEYGIRIPEDISLLGYDNIAFAALPRIHLTTVSQHKFQQSRIAVERLLEKINGSDELTADLLEPELIIRSTCARKPF